MRRRARDRHVARVRRRRARHGDLPAAAVLDGLDIDEAAERDHPDAARAHHRLAPDRKLQVDPRPAEDRPELYVSTLSYLKNSIVIGASTMVLTLLLAIPAAYASRPLPASSAARLIMPGGPRRTDAAERPPRDALFVAVRSSGSTGPQLAVIIADTALALPFGIILLHTSFRQVPGRSKRPRGSTARPARTTLRRVVVPLVRPGLVAVAVFSFLTAWGEFVFALVVPARRREPADLARRLPVRRACTRRSGTR